MFSEVSGAQYHANAAAARQRFPHLRGRSAEQESVGRRGGVCVGGAHLLDEAVEQGHPFSRVARGRRERRSFSNFEYSTYA